MKLTFIESKDGSHTLYRSDIDETYHSIHGAIQEAIHVFIVHGLQNVLNRDKIKILEVGFGTGLNAYLTILEANKHSIYIDYTGIEAFPIQLELISKLNYTELLNCSEEEKMLFTKMHQTKWGENIVLNEHFQIKKVNQQIEEFDTNEQFDLIYYDAFGPRAQEEMWNKSIFQNCYNLLGESGIFVTYCAKGQVRRDLQEIGFFVERLPGPPGKREMLRATKL